MLSCVSILYRLLGGVHEMGLSYCFSSLLLTFALAYHGADVGYGLPKFTVRERRESI